ncbi:hypothetical protein BSU6633_14992 [Bacillus spizizenii ATCC 6633 = JCM 2499]|nr:hypothetical protein BSU6633_14992 [Bacillus spizizenii ATCC 6633 = JCM 2499]
MTLCTNKITTSKPPNKGTYASLKLVPGRSSSNAKKVDIKTKIIKHTAVNIMRTAP